MDIPITGPARDGDRDASLIGLILRRRSASPRKLTGTGLSTADLRTLIEAAVSAPDHGRLRPWRFVHIGAARRDRLVDVFEAATRELTIDVDPDEIARAREQARNAPDLIAVLLRLTDHPRVPATEQYISTGAAIQNILLAAEALGFGATMLSGNRVRTAALRAAIGAKDGEHLIGFVAIGTTSAPARSHERPAVEDHLTEW